MSTSQVFLDRFYHRIVRNIALGTLIIAAVAILLTLIVYVLTTNLVIGLVVVIALVTGLGCLATLWLLTHERPLWQAILPFSLAVIGNELVIATWLPELRLAVAPFLAVVILLAGLNRQRAFTIGVMITCVLLIVAIVILGPTTEQQSIPLELLRFLQASSLAALMIAIWAFLDQIIVAQIQALDLADQRAAEAEAARQVAETARYEIAQRAEEQQRLLELVAALELPVLKIDDQVLLAPLVGNLDSRRAEQLRRRILDLVAEQRAHTVIIDITGITIIDTAVAKALIDTAAAIRLLGARTIISGIRPAVAQTLVHLNSGLTDITTAPNPQMALMLSRRFATV
ncbi:STAS domain-containing protein [Chloroflexus aggregans]|uniref:Anti-sigma-factor antagonist n=1 Tax=Chloroflexus aggregans (strain MD-66 / DSM 9485) TaxID=326427 RepID=B8G4Q1_CHLAD|nr:STAS domain-containing protein [Chloroflexus aggregans]ACL25527.1 anti-sigma-factor antagonist [Chloroflexus aggregans DSM 9485]